MVQTQKQKIGIIGENISVKHLVKHNYKIIERNYSKKWGEIDIIAEKDNILHFIEVKSQSIKFANLVSRETSPPVLAPQSCEILAPAKEVSHETFDIAVTGHMPEENVHPWKIKRLSRAIRTYLAERRVPEEQEFQVDIIAVLIDLANKKAKLRITENIIL